MRSILLFLDGKCTFMAARGRYEKRDKLKRVQKEILERGGSGETVGGSEEIAGQA